MITVVLVATLAAASWKPMGPFGGAAAFVTADPHHPGTFLAAGNNGLLFRTSDVGASWEPLRFPGQFRGVLHVLAVDPSRKDTYYAGMGGNEAAGLWRTSDAGVTWQRLPGLAGNEVWSIAFYHGDPRVTAAGTRTGVFLSADGGETWPRISPAANSELQPVVSLAFDPADRRVIYAGTPHLPWNTRDGGATWRSIHTGMLDDSDVFSIQVDHKDSSRVFATACSGIYASANGGGLWRKLRGAIGASYRTYFITQHPVKEQVLYAGTTHGLVKTEDGGTTWKQLSTRLTRALAFDPGDPERFLVATDDAGLQRTTSGGATLLDANRGFCNRHLTVLTAAPGALYTSTMYDASGGLFRLDGSGAWSRVAQASSLPGQQLLAIAPARGDTNRLYAAAMNGLAVSADSGKRWTPVTGVPAPGLITGMLAAPPRLYIGGEEGLFRRDGAGPWRKVDLGARIRGLFHLDGLGLAALTPSAAYLSRDGLAFAPMGAVPKDVELLAMAHAGRGVLLAATSHGVLRSDDGGATWQPETTAIRGTVSALCADPNRAGVVYAAHYGDVYEIRAFEKSSRRISPGVSPLQAIKSLAMLPEQPGTLFALTSRQGVFSLLLTD